MLPSARTLSPTQFSYPYSLTSKTETTNSQAKKLNAGTSTPSKDLVVLPDGTTKLITGISTVPPHVQEVIRYSEYQKLQDTYDPTPYYLYDDTNGEPPISWQERQDAEFRKEYGWA